MRLLKLSLTILCMALTHWQLNAQSQTPDAIIYEGDTLSLYSNPLEYHPDMSLLRPKLFGTNKACLPKSCWREYVAIWQIEENQLYLVGIYSCCYFQDKVQADLQTLFPQTYKDGKVKADWVSIDLVAPYGKPVLFIDKGYESFFEKEKYFSLEKGVVKQVKDYDNNKSRLSAYTNPNAFNQYIWENIDWGKIPNLPGSTRTIAHFSANEEGRIDEISLTGGINAEADQEIIRTIKSIPDWEVLYKKGAFYRRQYKYQITLNETIRERYHIKDKNPKANSKKKNKK